MKQVLRVSLPIPPSVNHLYRVFQGRAILSAAGREYKATAGWLVKAAATEQAWQASDRYRLTLRLWFANRRRRDLDNVLKVAQDSICDALGFDDARIDHLEIIRAGIDREQPRCDVTLEGL